MGINNFKNRIKKGKLNLITDVEGVKVGHTTLSDGDIQTGVTVIMPVSDNIFQNKCVASSYVINGFGKTSGLVQLNELGTLESPIALTNTLSVGTVQQALVKYMLSENDDIGVKTGTVNVIVGECNDGHLNDIRGCHIKEEHVYEAIKNATVEFEEGAVGGGRGMVCFSMKGGIGSSSRIVELDKEYHVGALVMTNFGIKKDFLPYDVEFYGDEQNEERGSIMIVLATDLPMSNRQLHRMCKRVPIALGRIGSHIGNGSGDIVIAFSTANRIPHYPSDLVMDMKAMHENKIDLAFRACIEAVEEAIYSSLMHATTVKGRDKHVVKSLLESMK